MAEPQRADDERGWLTRSQIAERVSLSVSSVDRAIASGELETRGKGRKRRSRAEWVDEWVNTWTSSVLVILAALLTLFVACLLGVDQAHHLLRLVHCPHA